MRLPILLEQPRAEFTRCSGTFAIVILGSNRNRVAFPALQGASRIADKGLLFVRHNAAVPIADAVCLHRNAHLRQYDILLFGLDKKRKFRQGIDYGRNLMIYPQMCQFHSNISSPISTFSIVFLRTRHG